MWIVNGRQTTNERRRSDDKSSHCLWQGELTTVIAVGKYVAPLGHIILIPSQPVFALSPYCCVLSGEATNTNFIVFCLTRPQFVPTIYRTRGEHANNYATDVVPYSYFLFIIFLIKISYCPSIYYLKTKINPKQ